ncbi:MAG: YifB family Mg chelatase-like AAA ATPase [Holosporales bacterium]|jgi:magnesium chelatase family protein|nr:YifB family Mg chelatase-like AAA ATPase [Holosporales bacterium]
MRHFTGTNVKTIAFLGVEATEVVVQVQIQAGLPAFTLVGLPDKTVAESRERIRAALFSLGLALPAKRITVNLAPADLQKEGSHYDLPIALGLLVAMGVIPSDALEEYCVLGELGLDGQIARVSGVLAAAVYAHSCDLGLICPKACGAEARWAGSPNILAAADLIALISHFKGKQVLDSPVLQESAPSSFQTKSLLSAVKGQPLAKRALEIAAAGGHALLLSGPPGAGKSMLATALVELLPPLTPEEALEVTIIHSLVGTLPEDGLVRDRPFRDPHHSASLVSLVGGGAHAKPGEISLAHCGVLFLDELPEFARATLEALRQPLETGRISIARAQMHVSYPARFQFVAAMNPCPCGYASDPERACSRLPRCMEAYKGRISGPFLDRIDLYVEVDDIPLENLFHSSEEDKVFEDIRLRVASARIRQYQRAQLLSLPASLNAHIDGSNIEKLVPLEASSQTFLEGAAKHRKISSRGYHRILKVARTIADLENAETITKVHLAEALHFRWQR